MRTPLHRDSAGRGRRLPAAGQVLSDSPSDPPSDPLTWLAPRGPGRGDRTRRGVHVPYTSRVAPAGTQLVGSLPADRARGRLAGPNGTGGRSRDRRCERGAQRPPASALRCRHLLQGLGASRRGGAGAHLPGEPVADRLGARSAHAQLSPTQDDQLEDAGLPPPARTRARAPGPRSVSAHTRRRRPICGANRVLGGEGTPGEGRRPC